MNRASLVVAAGAAVVMGAVLHAAPARAQPVALQRVTDLFGDRVYSSRTFDLAVVGSAAYVVRLDGGLVRTDGTDKGTEVLSTISPKIMPGPRTRLVGFRDRVYWLGEDKALWVSEGSGAATYNFWRGDTMTPTPPFVLGGSLYFFADGGLYRSEGTVASTQRVTDRISLSEAVVEGGFAYFVCFDDEGLAALCATDGTASGTTAIGALPGAANLIPQVYGVVGGNILVHGTFSTLWSVNHASRSVVTLPVDDLGESAPPPPVLLDGIAYFPCRAAAGVELCRTDGTVGGTRVLDLLVGSVGSYPQVARLGARLIVHAARSSEGHDLYSSDGTLAGTTLLKDLPASTAEPFHTRLVTVGDLVYFAVPNDRGDPWLARTDGTAAGTLVLDVGVASYPDQYLLEKVARLGDKLMFSGFYESTSSAPLISDGTSAGTRRVSKKLESSAFHSARVRAYPVGERLCVHGTHSLVRLGAAGGVFAIATFAEVPNAAASSPMLYYGDGASLFAADCTERSGVLVKELGEFITQLVVLGSRVVVRDETATVTFSDGTANGTVESDLLDVSSLASAGGSIWMMQRGTLLRSDGTRSGTAVVKTLSSTRVITHAIVAFGSYVALVVTVDGTRMELWRSDGTAAGTIRLKQLSLAGEQPPVAAHAWNDVLYFGVRGFERGELWRSDGTVAGTTRVLDIAPTGPMVAWGDHLFVAAEGARGAELWRSDGTAAGTVEVADLFVGKQGSAPRDLFVQAPAGPLMFSAATPEHGRELWSLADPAGKPSMVEEMARGPESSGMMAFHQQADTIYYYAYLDGHGTLWRTHRAPAPSPPAPLPEDAQAGCGCATGAPGPRAGAPVLILALGLLLRGRRRARARVGA